MPALPQSFEQHAGVMLHALLPIALIVADQQQTKRAWCTSARLRLRRQVDRRGAPRAA